MNTAPQTRTRLREFLDERGIRYIWVAEKLEVSPGHMSRLLDGTRPVTEDNAAKLAELFNVPASTFLPETDGGEG